MDIAEKVGKIERAITSAVGIFSKRGGAAIFFFMFTKETIEGKGLIFIVRPINRPLPRPRPKWATSALIKIAGN